MHSADRRGERTHQRIDDLAFDAMEMPRIRHVLKEAPAVEISLSLASVLVISAKVRSLGLEGRRQRLPAALRFPTRVLQQMRVGSIANRAPRP